MVSLETTHTHIHTLMHTKHVHIQVKEVNPVPFKKIYFSVLCVAYVLVSVGVSTCKCVYVRVRVCVCARGVI